MCPFQNATALNIQSPVHNSCQVYHGLHLHPYARVSIQNQNVELQREALPRAGCEKIFKDKISLAQSERPGLTRTVKILRAGNALVVWKLDRFGRSMKELIVWISDPQAQGLQFHSLDVASSMLVNGLRRIRLDGSHAFRRAR